MVKFDELVETTGMICGDVEHCIEKLGSIHQSFGFDEMLCWTRIGGLDRAKVTAAMELLSADVLPAVRKQESAAV